MKLFSALFKKKTAKQNKKQGSIPETIKLPQDLAKKMDLIRPYISKNHDIVTRPFSVLGKGKDKLRAVVIYMEGIIDTAILNEDILKPLMFYSNWDQLEREGSRHLIDWIYQTSLSVGQVKKADTLDALVQNIFDGLVILMFDGLNEVLTIDISGGERRSIQEPPTEHVIRGPREGFVENLTTNISLIRRKLRDPNLIVEKTVLGKRTRTNVAFVYIEDIADPEIVKTIKEKVSEIHMDGLLATGYIEQMIEDNHYSIFPQIQSTERPDKVVAHLLEGRVAILAEGTPFAIILPSLFIQFFQASDDYFDRPFTGSITRFARFLSFFLAVSLPAIYVSLLSFQVELIPFNLVLSLVESRKAVPLPVFVEILILELIIQLVVETGLRLPSTVGQTIGVVGGIVLGQAAISAHLASPGAVIITAITTICTFTTPSNSMALASRFLRLPLFLLASAFGTFGFSLGWLIILAHLASLESVGVPFFAPFAPTRFADLKDSFYRTFIDKMNYRPVSIPINDRKRQGTTGRKDRKNER